MSGGYDSGVYLSSTELLVETASAWVYTGELPSPRERLHGANIDNRILMTGNYCFLNILNQNRRYANKYLGGCIPGSVYDDILEFNPLTGQWELVDRMRNARCNHAVSVINVESGLCD